MSEALETIQQTLPDLDAWGARTSVPYRPGPGSALAEDDLGWPPMPLSQCAIAALASCRDHLQAVRVHIDAQNVFPFATRTLLRTAVLAGAQAVWMLAPDSALTRQQRGRTVAAEVYRRHGEFLSDLQSLNGARHAGTDTVATLVAERLAELAEQRAAAGERDQWQATKIIESAATATFGDTNLVEARVEWRAGSGAAHGLIWSVFGTAALRRSAVHDESADGLTAFAAGGSLDAVANTYMLAYGLARKGWLMMDDLGSALPSA